ncbi:MAG: hypothetical protein D6732_12425 [Methanobacteriota archaeon]|nr:MAG: hypothetical protein D6732_12425 [Euryarchaeota archaeon]
MDLLMDLETKVRLVFAWKKCLDVLSLPWDQKIKELPFAAMMLNLAYSLLDDNQNVQTEAPDGGEPAAELENALPEMAASDLNGKD